MKGGRKRGGHNIVSSRNWERQYFKCTVSADSDINTIGNIIFTSISTAVQTIMYVQKVPGVIVILKRPLSESSVQIQPTVLMVEKSTSAQESPMGRANSSEDIILY